MPGRLVLDASVAAKIFYEEPGRLAALELVTSRTEFVAPDLLFLEFASLSAKKARRGAVRPAAARGAVARLADFIVDVRAVAPLAVAAYALAVEHGFSVYDATYLALAEELDLAVVTADIRLVTRAVGAGLGDRVQALGEAV